MAAGDESMDSFLPEFLLSLGLLSPVAHLTRTEKRIDEYHPLSGKHWLLRWEYESTRKHMSVQFSFTNDKTTRGEQTIAYSGANNHFYLNSKPKRGKIIRLLLTSATHEPRRAIIWVSRTSPALFSTVLWANGKFNVHEKRCWRIVNRSHQSIVMPFYRSFWSLGESIRARLSNATNRERSDHGLIWLKIAGWRIQVTSDVEWRRTPQPNHRR